MSGIQKEIGNLARLSDVAGQPMGVVLLIGGSFVSGEILSEDEYWAFFVENITGGSATATLGVSDGQEDADAGGSQFLRLRNVTVITSGKNVQMAHLSVPWEAIGGFQVLVGNPKMDETR